MAGRRKIPKSFQEDNNNGDGWIWGNHRGGGGAPLKDESGNTITNLKVVLNSPGKNNHGSPQKRNNGAVGGRGANRNANYDDYDDDHRGNRNKPRNRRDDYENGDDYPPPNRGPRKNNSDFDGRDNRRRYHDEDDDYPNHRGNGNHAPHSPHGGKKFMSALSDMYGGNQQEKIMKAKKEQEYQNELKKQIEEKRRQKEEEKRKEEEIKRREYEEFIASTQGNRKPDQNAGKKPPLFKKESNRSLDDHDDDYQQSDNDDYHRGGGNMNRNRKQPSNGNLALNMNKVKNRGGRDEENDDDIDDYRQRPGQQHQHPRNQHRPYRDDHEDADDSRRYNNNNNDQSRARGVTNKRSNKDDYHDDTNDEGDHDDDNDSVRGHNQRNRRDPKKKFVPVDEYDQLSQLCDKLLAQQQQLQSEVQQQAELIKALQIQKNGGKPPLGNNKLAAAGNNKLNNNNNNNNNLLRSKSVQQSRPTAGGNKSAANLGSDKKSVNGSRQPAQESAINKRQSINQQRPSSMYEMSSNSRELKVSGHNQLPSNKREDGQQKKAMKVAFGQQVIGAQGKADKGSNNSKLDTASVASNASHQRGNKSPVNNNGKGKVPNLKSAMKSDISQNNNSSNKSNAVAGGGGFAKLLNNRNGPQVVTHEDEHDSQYYGRKDGGAGLELRGQSSYIAVTDDDNDYPDLVVAGRGRGDQIDKLLNNARKGKFA